MLTGKQRRHLRALAHAKKPLVQVGHAGLTEAVLAAIDQALETHELIKVKVQAENAAEVEALLPAVEAATRSSVAQVIGHTLLLYRRRKKQPGIVLPRSEVTRQKAVRATQRAARAPAHADHDREPGAPSEDDEDSWSGVTHTSDEEE